MSMTRSDVEVIRNLRKQVEALAKANTGVFKRIANAGHGPSSDLAWGADCGLRFEAERLFKLEGTMALVVADNEDAAALAQAEATEGVVA